MQLRMNEVSNDPQNKEVNNGTVSQTGIIKIF